MFNEEDLKPVSGSFFRFTEVGDQVTGTFVGKNQKPDNLNPGKMQWIYRLLTKDGSTVLIGGKPGIDMQMQDINIGQIVKFKFTSVKPTREKGRSDTHIITVYANPEVINEEWIKQQKLTQQLTNEEKTLDEESLTPVEDEAEKQTPNTEEEEEVKVEDIPFNKESDKKTEKKEIDAKIRKKIYEMFGISKQQEVMTKAMEVTNLPYTDSNKEAILKKLKEI